MLLKSFHYLNRRDDRPSTLIQNWFGQTYVIVIWSRRQQWCPRHHIFRPLLALFGRSLLLLLVNSKPPFTDAIITFLKLDHHQYQEFYPKNFGFFETFISKYFIPWHFESLKVDIDTSPIWNHFLSIILMIWNCIWSKCNSYKLFVMNLRSFVFFHIRRHT